MDLSSVIVGSVGVGLVSSGLNLNTETSIGAWLVLASLLIALAKIAEVVRR